ncbi:hypothetical protein FUAX_02400 [Fulvitalea axinellae]|uniref:Uncharacterized protein n=1 Tax=Fulvitalea axinellae TaxID=1182444 RepID=A0AAU9CW57_9BACT|nr:hypothetical protein FUAX_02400 [Fulvitalea axinellae]
MTTFILEPSRLVRPDVYPKLAQNLVDCQIYLSGEQKYIRELGYKAFEKEAEEEKAEGKRQRFVEDKKKLESEIQTTELRISVELDPKQKERLETHLEGLKIKLRQMGYKEEDDAGQSLMELTHTNAEGELFELYVKAYRQSVLDYINDYVVPGTIGEGTVEFEGVEYVAELAAQD